MSSHTRQEVTNPTNGDALLEVRDLKTYYKLGKGREIRAVENLSFKLDCGDTLGIVGESGSGKSTVSRSLIRLVDKPGYIAGGQITWKGRDLLQVSPEEMTKLRGKEIGLIFQDPTTSLNPLRTIGGQLLETLQMHLDLTGPQAHQRVLETLELVGIREGHAVFHKYPCDYSTGFRQRVMIAMSIVCRPDLVIADEPTTMLGVTVQAQILSALKNLQDQLGMAMILITHDFGVVSEVSDRILVMYAGYAMEYAPKRQFLLAPKHPYSLGLISSVPIIEARRSKRLKVIPGFPPDMLRLPPGCPFAPRCDYAQDKCRETMPPLEEMAPNHWCACYFPVAKADLDLVEQLSVKENL
jgi:oligopeptide transport system ATP-binding protein